MGGDPAGRLSPDPGLRSRRRMGRRRADGGRTCARRQEGLLRQLAATRRAAWAGARHPGLLGRVLVSDRRRALRLGLAPSVPVQHRAGDRRFVDQVHDRRIARVPEDQGLQAGSENADRRRDPHVSKEHPAGDGRTFRGKRLLLHLRDIRSRLRDPVVGHEQAGHIERRADRRRDRNLHDPGLRRPLRPCRAPARLYFRRHFLGADVVPAVHAARDEKPATWLDRDRSGSGRRARRHVRPAGELPVRTVRHQGALQRRVARLQPRLDLRRRAVAADRHRADDRLQAGDMADLRLHDRAGADHDRFGLFRNGNAEEMPRPESATPNHRGAVAGSERTRQRQTAEVRTNGKTGKSGVRVETISGGTR